MSRFSSAICSISPKESHPGEYHWEASGPSWRQATTCRSESVGSSPVGRPRRRSPTRRTDGGSPERRPSRSTTRQSRTTTSAQGYTTRAPDVGWASTRWPRSIISAVALVTVSEIQLEYMIREGFQQVISLTKKESLLGMMDTMMVKYMF